MRNYYIDRGWNEVCLYRKETIGYFTLLHTFFIEDMDWRYGHAPYEIHFKCETKLIDILFETEQTKPWWSV